jgi:putative salt-induced outer membrane protein YdiY
MNTQSIRGITIIAMTGMLLALPSLARAAADVVVLKNGDRITGEIYAIWDGEIEIEPSYADEIFIDIAEVAYFVSDRTFEIELSDHVRFEGRFETDESGAMALISERGRQPIAPAEVEELDELSDEFDWEVRSDLSFSASEGNSETSDLTWQNYGRIEQGDHRHELNLSINRATREGDTTQDRTRAGYRYSWFMSDRWFLSGGLGYERDPVRELDYRILPGAGVGYQFFDDADRLFEISVSAVGVSEKLGGTTEESGAARWQARYRRQMLDGDLEFFHDQSVFAYVVGRDNTAIETSTGIRWDVWADIYLNMQFDWDYESNPAAGAENEDRRYIIGLGVELD